MRVLIACEESQTVCKAFRAKGHEAYSCDIIPASGGHPEWHIQGDAIATILSQKWDLVIAHPPCTYLCNSGVRWLKGNPKRIDQMLDAMQFFTNIKVWCIENGIPLCIENPIPHKYAVNDWGSAQKGIGKYTQLIQPYQFGHLEKKATCLWLYNLPELIPTHNVYEEMMKLPYAQRAKVHYTSPGKDRAKLRSKTYEGIAQAMADQWG